MSTVDIPLNHFIYRFRKLTFEEEFGVVVQPGEDSRRSLLNLALTEVSSLVIDSREKAAAIISVLPQTVVSRVWLLYRAGLPEDRFFSTKGLYRAPEPNAIVQRAAEEEERRTDIVDRSFSALEQKFGRKELEEVRAQERGLIADARKRGTLVRATAEEEA